jgi:hypothetical protein
MTLLNIELETLEKIIEVLDKNNEKDLSNTCKKIINDYTTTQRNLDSIKSIFDGFTFKF